MTEQSQKRPSVLPEAVVQMVLAGDERRDSEATTMWTHLTDRERALVREAAVMGYVNGVMAERGNRESIPKDMQILKEVLLACRSMRDQYPNLGWLTAVPKDRS